MAISDFFSGGQTPDYLSGLLDDEQLRKLKEQAQQNALMQFGLSALSQGGYSQTPVGIGEILGKSGMAGMQGYQQGVQSGIEGIGTRAKLEELQRKKQEETNRKAYLEKFVSTLPEDQRAAVTAMPELGMKLAEKALLPKEKKYQQVGNQLIDVTETPTVAFTGEKEVKALPTYTVDRNRVKYTVQVQPDGSEKVIGQSSMDAPQRPSEPSYSIQTDKNGKAIYVPNKPGMPSIDAATGQPTVYEPKFEEKPLTEGQGKAANFYNRMVPITKKLNTPMIDKSTKKPMLNEDGTQMTLEDVVGNPSITAQTLRAIPSFGVTSKIADVGIGNLRKQVETLKENWLTANLRKESGAVIGEEEFAREDKKYFPQIGDSFEVRQLKKQLRRQAEEGMLLESGKGVKPTTQGWSIKKVGG